MVFASPKGDKNEHAQNCKRVHRTLQDESPLALQLGLLQNNILSMLLTYSSVVCYMRR